MVRLGSVALIILSLPAAAWCEPPAPTQHKQQRSLALPLADSHRFAPQGSFGRAEIAPNAHFGFGIFGLKLERTPLQPVTGRELRLPKQRRAAVGFSVRF